MGFFMTTQDGIIKYQQILEQKDDFYLYSTQINELNRVRHALFKMELIGSDSTGVCFGNISCRIINNRFMITASQTGHLELLSENKYCYVKKVNLKSMKLWTDGVLPASSEALTHYAIYTLDPKITAVIHIHSLKMWNHEMQTKSKIITSPNVTYGTYEMALEMQRTFNNSSTGSFVLGGHKEGLIYYSTTLNKALNLIKQDYAFLK